MCWSARLVESGALAAVWAAGAACSYRLGRCSVLLSNWMREAIAVSVHGSLCRACSASAAMSLDLPSTAGPESLPALLEAWLRPLITLVPIDLDGSCSVEWPCSL